MSNIVLIRSGRPSSLELSWGFRSAVFILVSMIAALSFSGQDRWTSNGPEGGLIMDLAVNSSEPATLYAATYGGGIYRSTDAGETWKPVNDGVNDYFVRSLAIDPASPSTIYAGTYGGQLMKSVDAGNSWVSTFNGSSIRAVLIDPANHLTLYVATGDGVFTSTDGGASWINVSKGLPFDNQRVDVWSLAIDRSNPSRLYAGLQAGIYTSKDRGREWSYLNSPRAVNVNAIAVDPANSQRIYVASDNVILQTTDGGRSWKLSSPGSSIRGFLIDPSRSGTVYAASDIGVFRTTDSGATWRLLPPLSDIPFGVLVINLANPSVLYAGASGAGVFRSTDDAASWSRQNSGLTAGYTRGVAFPPSNPSLIYAATADGVFKTVNRASEWIRLNAGVKDPATVTVDPVTPSTVYAAGYEVARKTSDGGETWTQIRPNPSNFSEGGVREFAIDPANTATLYAALADSGISRSTNGGQSWSLINSGLTFGYYGFSVYSVAVDPSTPSTLFVGSEGIAKSTDSGDSWNSVSEGLWQSGGYNLTPQALAIDPGTPSIIYAATWKGMYRTVDGALHWSTAQNGMSEQSVADVAIDPSDPSTVYAATYASGIFRSTDRGLSWTLFNNGLSSLSVNSIAIDSTGRFLAAATAGGAFTYDVASGLPPDLRTERLPDDSGRLPRLLNQLRDAGSGFIIVATGKVSGIAGSRFRSDVSLVNHADTSQDVLVAWLAAGLDGTNAPSFRVTLPASPSSTIAGLVDKLGFSGLGCLVVIATDANGNVDSRASIDGSSRLWMTSPNNPGTVSQSVPSVPIQNLGKRTTSSATGLRSDQDFRTNIGVVNLDIRPRTFSVDVIGERYTATVSIEIEPLSMRQIPVPRGDYGALRAVFNTSSSDFPWTAYGSSVNNFTGEGSVVLGQ